MKYFIKIIAVVAAVVLSCMTLSSCTKEETFDGLYLNAEEILGKDLETWDVFTSGSDVSTSYYVIVLTLSDAAIGRMMKYEKETTDFSSFTLRLKKGDLTISWLPSGYDYSRFESCVMISRTGETVIGCYDEAVIGSIYAML